jgi:hypothetical protein
MKWFGQPTHKRRFVNTTAGRADDLITKTVNERLFSPSNAAPVPITLLRPNIPASRTGRWQNPTGSLRAAAPADEGAGDGANHHAYRRRSRTLQQPPNHHLAQLNIGRIRHEIDDPRMADFTHNLALVNGIAERSAGFIWRYTDESGNATNTRPYADPRIIVNFRFGRALMHLSALSGGQSIGASMAAAPIGSSILKGHLSCCGGCRSAIGRVSKRLSRASSI